MPEPLVEKPKPFPLRGCVVFVGICGTFLAVALWVGGEPSRNARTFRESVRAGMSLAQVIGLAEGRFVCQGFLPSENTADGPREAIGIAVLPDGSLSLQRGRERQQFRTRTGVQDAVTELPPECVRNARYVFTFLGLTPGHASVAITFGEDGKADTVTGPKFWD